MPSYRTPGVYVEEIATLPPSVAEVSTAVPAFFGYTERGSGVARVSTLLEFEEAFGGPQKSEYEVKTRPENADDPAGPRVIDAIARKDPEQPRSNLYYALSHYFANGGGSCYVVSVGGFGEAPQAAHFTDGLSLLAKEDEPTLLVLTDAVNLDAADYYAVAQAALAQCAKLGDRFTIVDVKDGDVAAFRGVAGIGAANLKYGAAYYPYLQTTITERYDEAGVTIVGSEGGGPVTSTLTFGADGVTVSHTGEGAPQAKFTLGDANADLSIAVDAGAGQLTIGNVRERTGAEVAAAWDAWKASNDAGGFSVTAAGDGSGAIDTLGSSFNALVAADNGGGGSTTLAAIKSGASPETALYNSIRSALAGERVVLAPSAAIAGIYAEVDRTRGVWKAPANVGVASVIGPVTKITNDEQGQLNVDATGGKSVNAIRAFAGKGTLVWGARTLAGNDNEWRYVSVRRLFITVEESVQKATAFAVFEPNDSTTWLKVKGMIESYLYGLWERGALAGASPDAAYFVNVGLGKTMTPQDVLEGRMNVEIGLAAVRPAEFIILRFSHKLQEA
ncbi:MAG: phage tail sheath C-terminal domain-containing protein [Nannocystaceae bacterium]